MRQFQTLPGCRKNHRVIAHDVAAAQRVHADFRRSALAGDALSAVSNHFAELLLANIGEDFREGGSGSARRILLHPVMHLDDFQIEVWSEYLRRLAGEPEQRVDAGGIIRRPNHWNPRFEI